MKNKQQAMAWDAFLKRLREMLSKDKETYESIGERLGVGKNTVFEWLNYGKGGKRTPFETMARYMRGAGLNPEDYFSISETEESDFEYVRKAKTQLGAGSSLVIENGHSGKYAFRKEFIRSLGHNNASNLVLFDVIGDSMQPVIVDGDTVLVEIIQDPKPRTGEIWAAWYNEDVLIKRIIPRANGGYTFSSINDNWKDINVEGEQDAFGFIGKVRWLGRFFN